MSQREILAYLAGVMDSDGYLTIKKSTYNMRVTKDAYNPTYSEKIGMNQIQKTIPDLLKETFGGTIYRRKAYTENSRPQWSYHSTDLQASKAVRALMPFLRLKIHQAEVILELRESKNSIYNRMSYWFAKEFPEWQKLELIELSEASEMLEYSSQSVMSRAIESGVLLATPYVPSGRTSMPRVPRLLVERLVANKGKNGGYCLPPSLVRWREELYQRITELNKVGINGTSSYHKTGYHTQKEVINDE